MDTKVEIGAGELPSNEAPPARRRTFLGHPVAVWISRIINIGLILYLISLFWPTAVGIWSYRRPHTACNKDFATINRDSNLKYNKRELVHFDIDVPAYGPITPNLSIIESLSICHYSYAWNASGTIRLAPGDPDQEYNFMVGMDISGSSQMAIDSVVWPIHSDSNSMYIRCVEAPFMDEVNTEWDATIRVDVTVFVKPHTLQFGEFKIGADVLDIQIAEGLSFETYHMKLYSGKGSIRGEEIEGFVAHEIEATSMNGSITGNWSLPRIIEFRTGGWNSLDRPIDIDLIPKQWSSGPTTQGFLSAITNGGNIDIRMPLTENLSLRNMSINLSSRLGSISGTYITGYQTSVKTLSGSINATLQPYYAMPDTCYLATSTSAGDTNLRLLPPIIDEYYQVNPLKNTKSEHSTTSGLLKLQYPRQWAGAALGLSETGSVTIEGDRLKTIVQEDHLVVARTDDEIASRLDFSTTTGNGKLVIE